MPLAIALIMAIALAGLEPLCLIQGDDLEPTFETG
jgi:hypothetical protein